MTRCLSYEYLYKLFGKEPDWASVTECLDDCASENIGSRACHIGPPPLPPEQTQQSDFQSDLALTAELDDFLVTAV